MTERKKRRNQLGEVEDDEDVRMTVERWDERWQKGQTRFHKEGVHQILAKFYETMTNKEEKLRIFLPLCGKSLDLKWLAEKGHQVVGLEAVELACQHFFEENEIEYERETTENHPGKVFKSKVKGLDITIYCADFLLANRSLLGSFDCIWDRGSFAAIEPEERERYAKVILDIFKPTSRYLLETFMMDHDIFTGPPHSCTTEQLDALFGSFCDIELLNERDAMGDWQREWGVTYFRGHVRLLTLKK